MHRDSHAAGEQGTPRGLRLANAWAEFSRALSIYPESNERVQGRLAAVVEHVQQAVEERGASHDPERGITVIFHDSGIHFDRGHAEIAEGSSLAWLRERLTHAGLAGVEFMPDLEPASVVTFTKQLLANFLRKEVGLTYEDLWPDRFEHIVLIDLRFEGTFGGMASDVVYRGGHLESRVRVADTNNFLRGLLAHPKVLDRAKKLSKQRTAGEASVGAGEVLKRILNDVPAEALKSRDALITAVSKVMDDLLVKADAAAMTRTDGSGEAGSDEFASLLYQVSRGHFGRQGPGLERLKPNTEEAVEQTPGGGRARDAQITGDVHSLLEELQALPAQLAYDFAAGEAESRAEQLGTLLHYLTHLERPHELPGLYPLLARLVDTPDPEALGVLRDHLQAEGVDEEATNRAHAAIIRFLVAAGHAHLLRTCGILTNEFVLEDVPTRLPLMLAAIDTKDPEQLADLDALCKSLGHELIDLSSRMREHLEALSRDQVVSILRRPYRERLPLVRVLVEVYPESLAAEATTFLRSLDLPEEEAFVLYQLHDPRHITREYLCALMDLHLERVHAKAVHATVVDLLCSHIRATRKPLPQHPERLESIRSLARYPSANGWHLLKELSKTFFGPFGGREPAMVRKLARSVLKKMGGMKGGMLLEAPGTPSAAVPSTDDDPDVREDDRSEAA